MHQRFAVGDAGVSPRDLQAIMRQSSITTTEKYYLRHRAAEQADRIARQLGTNVNAEPVDVSELPLN